MVKKMSIKVFFIFVCALVCLKIFAIFNTSFGLFGDEAQYWLWSRSFDLGYFSKPPLLAWFLGLYTNLFGSEFISLKFFAMPFYTLTAYLIYRICIKLELSKKDSISCALVFFIIPSASLSSFLISTDVILLLFWSMLMNLVLIIRSSPKNLYFVFFGVVFGLALLAKYAAIYFLICLFFLTFYDKKSRLAFKTNPLGLLLFVLVSSVFLFPNLLWNHLNNWVTFSHTADNANLNNYNISLLRGLGFLTIQIAILGPVIFFGFLINIKNLKFDFQNLYLLSFSIPILVIVFFESVIVRANANWAAPALLSLLIFFFRSIKKYKYPLININFFFNWFVGCFLFFSIAMSYPFSFFNRINGVKEFALEIVQISKESSIIVNDRMLFSSLAYELRHYPVKILMPHNPKNPISNHFQLKSNLKKNYGEGFFLIGDPINISYLSKKYQTSFIKRYDKKFTSEPIYLYEVTF